MVEFSCEKNANCFSMYTLVKAFLDNVLGYGARRKRMDPSCSFVTCNKLKCIASNWDFDLQIAVYNKYILGNSHIIKIAMYGTLFVLFEVSKHCHNYKRVVL